MLFYSQKGQTTIILLAVVFVFSFLLIGGLGDATNHTILTANDPNQIQAQQENGGLMGQFENLLGLGGGDIQTPTPTPTPTLAPGATIAPSPTPTGLQEYPPRPVKFFWDEPSGSFTNPQIAEPSNSKNGMQMNSLIFVASPTPIQLVPPPNEPPIVINTPSPVVNTPPPVKSNQPGQKCIHEQLISNGCICSGSGSFPTTCQGGKNVDPKYDPSQVGLKWCASEADGNYCVGKPVIYLYPQKPTMVDVKLTVPGTIVVSDPLYKTDGGWQNVFAQPDGQFEYEGKTYRELFYETSIKTINAPQKGILIAQGSLRISLSQIVTRLGLMPSERDEFLDYWMPKLQALHSPYIFFSILNPQEKDRIDHVDITPKPDTMIEFLVYFRPVWTKQIVAPLILPSHPPQRKGFTAVEWGGTIDEKSSLLE